MTGTNGSQRDCLDVAILLTLSCDPDGPWLAGTRPAWKAASGANGLMSRNGRSSHSTMGIGSEIRRSDADGAGVWEAFFLVVVRPIA